MLTRLEIRNIKKISFLEFDNKEEDRVIEISGKNAQGKSSILDAIEMALNGGKAKMEYALRAESEEGYVLLENENIKVKRRFYKGKYGEPKTNLNVWDKGSGEIIQKPKDFLNRLFGPSLLRPNTFTECPPKERVATLKEALGIDFTELDDGRTRLFSERTEVGREQKLSQGHLQAYDHLPRKRPKTREMDEVLGEIKELEKFFDRERNEETERAKEFREYNESQKRYQDLVAMDAEMKTASHKIEAEIKYLKERLATAKENHKQNTNKMRLESEKVKELKKNLRQGYKVPETKVLKMGELREELKEISSAEKTNQEFKMREQVNDKINSLGAKYRELTEKIEEIDKTKKRILEKTEFPLKGLSFGDEDLLLNGVPFFSLSSAEKIKITISIYTKLDNAIKIILLEDGSLLDDESMAAIREMAGKNDYTIIVESVTRGENNSLLVIEEGELYDKKTNA